MEVPRGTQKIPAGLAVFVVVLGTILHQALLGPIAFMQKVVLVFLVLTLLVLVSAYCEFISRLEDLYGAI